MSGEWQWKTSENVLLLCSVGVRLSVTWNTEPSPGLWYELNIFRLERTKGRRLWKSYWSCHLRAGAESLVHSFSFFPGILSTMAYTWWWIYWITSVIVSVHKKTSAEVASDVGVTPKLCLCSAIKQSFLLASPFFLSLHVSHRPEARFPKVWAVYPTLGKVVLRHYMGWLISMFVFEPTDYIEKKVSGIDKFLTSLSYLLIFPS